MDIFSVEQWFDVTREVLFNKAFNSITYTITKYIFLLEWILTESKNFDITLSIAQWNTN
jgi:hypothetical protein